MIRLFFLLLPTALLFTMCSTSNAAELMEQYMWKNRVLLVFSPSVYHPDYSEQMEIIKKAKTGMDERDMVLWQFIDNERVMLNGERKPQLGTPPFYEEYKVLGHQFTVILIGKDGGEKLRQYSPLTAEKLFTTIDSMPMRQGEMRE